MYYETTMHESRPMNSAADVAKAIKSGDVRDYHALTWEGKDGRRFAAVADNHCNNPWLEVAVIDLTNNVQIESLTFGWMDEEKAARYLTECETTDFKLGQCKLPLDGNGDDSPAWFECGCCGDGFESTYAKQKKFDQDNGYGICLKCCRYYGG